MGDNCADTWRSSIDWLLRSLLILLNFEIVRGGAVVQCPELTSPADGRVNYGRDVGDTAAYGCDKGYSLVGTNFRECQSDFTWTLTSPTCDIVGCSTPIEPTGGSATYTTTTYQSTLTYSCDTGYTRTSGATAATCEADGNWDNGPPSCTIDDCGSLSNPTNGTVSASVTTFGATATYTCLTGYRITAGSSTRTCQAGEIWDGSEPTCTIQDCGSLTKPSDGSVSVTATTFGSSATVSCDVGYDLNGDSTVNCQADGNWEALPTCDIKDCDTITAPSNGEVSVTTTTYNSVATFSCDTGHDLDGATSATCLDTGSWSASPPTCTIVDCGDLDPPKFGFVNHDPGTVYNFVAAYTCELGYDLKGSNIRRCQANATWSSIDPTCELYDCGTPNAPINGDVNSDGTTYGSKAQYVCDTGYNLIGGTENITCGEGTWSGTEPTCEDIDECTAGTDDCDVNAACTNTDGGFTCSCNSGFSGDGVSCTDIDECTARTDNCDVNAACTNTDGGFTCSCNAGFSGDGETCTDIDECTAGTDNCDVNAACANAGGTFTCTCNSGYMGDGVTCADEDECTADTHNCDVNAACANTVGGFTCACNSGYSGDGETCTDINECTAGTDNCDVNAACADTDGGFTCTCNSGYSGDGETCADIDECTAGTDNCDVNAACANTVGSFTCTCNAGYSGDGETCTDIDECTSGTDNCDVNAACTNTDGGFTCACNSGYAGDGETCADIDECTAGTDNCDVNAACANTVGGFTCTCNAGYSGDGETCTDIDECSAGTDNCDANAACTNTDGSFTCTCNSGYTGNGVICTDIDECTAGTDNCDANAACANTVGGFTCTCNSGYAGDGETCTDTDECTAGTDNCDVNAACVNTVGGFTCTCNSGYSGDGTTCTDIDECTTGTDDCDVNAACTNIDGGFTCTCNNGYSGDGVTCQDCGTLNNITNGIVAITGTTYLETAIYTCDTGYYISSGDATRVCIAVGSWNGTEPVCTIRDCGNLNNPTSGEVSFTSTTYQSTATYTCSLGYRQTRGSTTRTCQASGKWDGVKIGCSIYTCPALSDPVDGTVTADGNTYGDEANYSCNVGYDLNGSESLICYNGSWDNSAPTCTIKDCGSLSAPDDGQVNTQPGTTYQKLASYTCNLGYDLVGDNVRECQADGVWDGTVPTCQIVDCLALTDPSDGTADTSSGTTFFQVATYTCDTGYEISAGSANRTCGLDGNWNGTEPVCSRKNCGSLPKTIQNGSVAQSGTLYQDTSVYTCSTGYYNSTGVVSVTIACAADGSWDGFVPSCIPVDCGVLAAPDGGQIDHPSTTYNTRASYTCNIGHDLIGTNVRTCGADGNWDGAVPVCQIKDCNSLTDPADGAVEANVTTYGETAVYTCDAGYRITSGSATRTCGVSGTWDGAEPVCTLYDCGTPNNVASATVSFTTTTYGNTAVYTCDTGYYNTAGSLTRTCGEGQWNGTEPTCTIRDCRNLGNPSGGSVTFTATSYNEVAQYSCDTGYYSDGGNPQRICQADGNWNGTELQCTIYDCQVPQSTSFGTVNYTTTTYGSQATYTCNTGYFSTDTLTLTCGTGTWTPTIPTCTIQDCGTLSPVVIDGSVVFSGTTYGETAVYTCAVGFLVNNTSSNTHTLICAADGSWDGTVPTCTAVDCHSLDAPKSGGVDTSGGTGYQDVAAYTCIHGFQLIGTNIRTCKANGDWNGTAPVCIPFDCGPLSAPADGSVLVTVTTFSASASYTCDIGYYISSGASVRTCVHGGSWNGTQPTCTVYDCGPLSDPANGVVNITGETYGEKATYRCNTGHYRTDGHATRTCGNGTWLGEEPTCTIRDCGVLRSPPNGQVSLTGGTTYLQVANYSCDIGYRENDGNAERTCGADGKWNGTELVCLIYDCGVPANITNGRVTYTGRTYGENATYTCVQGYYISSGIAERECREGFWSGTEPVCTIHDCGTAGVLDNGHVDATRTQYMDSANYTCDEGYVIEGTQVAMATRMCQDNGSWSGELPKCFYIDCGVLGNPANGTVDISHGTGLGDTAAYTCNVGYEFVGNNVRTCQANGSWDRTEPNCAIKECGQLDNPSNGQVKLTGTTYGETASYTCNNGFYISSGSAARMCRSNGAWDGIEPVCTEKIGPTQEPNTTPVSWDEREMVCGHRNEDLVFGISVSSMTRGTDFLVMKNLVKNAVYRSDIDSGDVRIGVYVFGQNIYNVIHLNDYNSRSELMQAIDDIPYSSVNGPSPLHVGLSQLQIMFSDINGDRLGVPNYAFIILDDNVNITGNVQIADELRNVDIHLDMFAIGFTDTSVLSGIVYQQNGHIFPLQSYDILQLTVRFVLWKDSRCNCGTLDPPTSGGVTVTGTFYLDVATHTCDAGYNLVGSEVLTCQYGGLWSGSPPVCIQDGSGTTQPPTNTPSPDTALCGYVDVDIIFALAVSRTVDQSEYNLMMNLVQTVIDHSDIDRGNVRFGFFVFDSDIRTDTVVNMNEFNTREELRQAVDNNVTTPFTQGARLSVALSQIVTMSLTRRQNVPLMAYIALDSDISLTNSTQIASQMRKMGILLSFVAVEFSNLQDLQALAFTPSPVYTWEIPNFAVVGLIASQFLFKDEDCNCGTPERPINGSVTVTGTYFLDEATFSCDVGYILVGSQLLVCQYGGSWTGSTPSCIQGSTPKPTEDPLMDIECGFTNVDVVMGFAMSRSMVSEEFGHMKALLETAIEHADIDSGNTRFGSFIFDTNLRTDSVATLDRFKSRREQLAFVDSIQYTVPSAIQATLATGLRQLFVMFTSPTLSRRPGVPTIAFIIADENIDLNGTCTPADQLRSNGIVLSFITVSTDFVTLQELKGLSFSLDSNYNIDFPSYMSLGMTAVVSLFKEEECDCGVLPNLNNGTITYEETDLGRATYFLDVASFSCNQGYDLVGTQQFVCRYGGLWTGSLPSCVPTGVTVSPPTSSPVFDTTCGLRNLDVVFGVALSDATSELDFEVIKNYIKTSIDSADVDAGLTQIGFFVYGQGFAMYAVAIDTYKTRSELHTSLDNFQFVRSTNTPSLQQGLLQARDMFSVLGNRQDVQDLLYMIIDNKVDLNRSLVTAQQIKTSGIHLRFIAVGILHPTKGNTEIDVQVEQGIHFENYEDLQRAVTEEFYRNSTCYCGVLLNPTDGVVLFDEAYYLDHASFFCNNNFDLVGSQQLVCQYGGAWSGSRPSCSPKASLRSVDLRIHLNMTALPGVDLTNSVTYNTYENQVKLALEKHYGILANDNAVEIVVNSISRASLLVNYTVVIRNTETSAQEFAQSSVGLARGATIEIFNENLTATRVNIGTSTANLVTLSPATVGCTTFLEAIGSCDLGYICQLEGDVPKCLPDPTTDCGFPGSVGHGMVVTADGTLYGTIATYLCNIGYNLQGSDTRICEPSGLWRPQAPTCVLIDCGNLSPPSNGIVDLSGGTGYGQTAAFSCLPGYALVGQGNLECIEMGVWSEPPPTCVIIDSYCGSLLDPSHGSVSTSDLTSINSRALYSCNLGYRLLGPETRRCSENTNWEPQQLTECIIQDCGTLRNPVNGNVDQSSGTTYGQTVIFSCSVGYQIFGAEQATCMANGNWSIVIPECRLTNCGGLPNPKNGLVSASETTFGQVATYTCSLGYTMSGTSSRICQPNGVWSSREPDCILRDCGTLFSPVNGFVDTSTGTTYGSMATYRCSQGYNLTGSNTTLCEHTGIWDPPGAPSCVVIDCGTIDGPDHGRVTLSRSSRFGSKATFRCDAGYRISGPSSRQCLQTGQWSDIQTSTICSIVDCQQLPDIQYGSVSYRDSLTVHGSTATFSCNGGYYLNTATITTTCLDTGNWDIVNMPSCTIHDCGIPPEISNGSRSYTDTTYGSFAYYICDTGYDRTGSERVVCTADGSWDTLPTCSKINCASMQAPANGSVVYTSGSHVGSEAVFDCDPGFSMTGANVSVCSEAGNWTSFPPFCILYDCGSMSAPAYGSVTLSAGTMYNSTATFSCYTGYRMFGPDMKICSDDGLWEPLQATKCTLIDCGRLQNPVNGNVQQSSGTTYGKTVTFSCSVGYELFGAEQITCTGDGKWSNAAPNCQITDCGGLSNPASGEVSANQTTFGQLAVYTCSVGYSLVGTSSRICQPTGSWTGSPPTCLVKDCGSLPSPAFGTVQYNDTLFESDAIYTCNTGHRLEGLAKRTCSADGRWSGTTPVCAVIDCGTLSSIQFGTFRPPSRNTFGTQVTYSCKTGYQLTGTATVSCLETSLWSDLPSCVIVDCGELTRPQNGQLSLPGGTTYGQTAVFSCQTGYIPIVPVELTCQSSGLWSGTPPTCELADCGILTNPVNGGVTISGTKFGDYATYVCDAGHQLVGSSSRLCQENGNWSGSPPSCTVRDCGVLTAPEGGNVTVPKGTTYGQLANFVCNNAYDLVGLSTLVCRADGTWSSTAPACTLKQGLLSKDLILTLNLTVPAGVDFSNANTYTSYLEEVRLALTQHYGSEMKNSIVEIVVNSLKLGSLIVDYKVILKDNQEAVNNFTQASVSLAKGSPLQVFNQALGASRMTVDNSQVNLVSLSVTELACKFFLDLSGPCQNGYVCTLVNDSPVCGPDPNTDCGIPARPANGVVNHSGGTLYGNTVIYTCDTGFTLVGHNTRTCQGDGNWAPAAPTCSVTECIMLGDPVNGRVTIGGTVHGQTAFFACKPGFSLIGAAVITCQMDGNWNYPPPTCRVTGCGGLPSPTHGSVTISTDGLTASYSCQTGYILRGDSLRTCQPSNVWSGAEPICDAIECVNLLDPANGRVDLSGISYGSTATYHCTEVGYILSGTGTRVCGQDGQWSSNAPTCNIIECDVLAPLANGNIDTLGRTYGQTATFSCNQGFILQGAQTLTCMAFGWSSTIPTCQSIGDCGSLDNPVHGFLTSTLGTAFLSKATYSCYMGYRLIGTEERVCQVDNTWSGEAPSCKLVDCGLPSIPDGGRVDYTSGTTYGRVVAYTCNTGYDLIGPATVTCQNDGTWSNTPSCRAKDCGFLPHPVNGLVDTVAGTTYGSSAVYTCNPGYYLQGVKSRTCLATGSWETLVPTCIVKDCGSLTTPANGVVNVPSGTTYGQTATYTCYSGYVLTGSATRQCSEDGAWTGTPPVCVAVVCGSLSNPMNGKATLSNGLVVGSVATYTCSPGYLRSPISHPGRTCQENGAWTDTPPVCILIDCGILSEPMFGAVFINETTFGFKAEFTCNQGYMLTGSKQRNCAADGYWTGTQPECTVTDCGSLSSPDNGKVTMPDGTRFGDVAVYDCNSGYSIRNNYKRTCQSNGTWSGVAPFCESSRDFALAVGLGVGITGFVILILVITLVVVILYRRDRSKHFSKRTTRKYALAQPVQVPPPMPVKINTAPAMLVPYYNGPAIVDDDSDYSDRHTTWRSRKADYGDHKSPMYYNVNLPRDEYYPLYRN